MENNLIEECKRYMLSNEMIEKDNYKLKTKSETSSFSQNSKKNVSKITENINESKKENYFIPNRDDKLFWCFYIILRGEYNYELNNNFKTEKEIKIESIEKLREIKGELKAMKLKLNGIEDELLNDKKMGIKSLIALCLLYKKNIMYIWNRKFYEIIHNNEEDINIIINENGVNKLIMEIEKEKIEKIREDYLRITNIEKPFKAITAYTRDELLEMAHKLDIKNIEKKTKKKEIYEKIKFDCI